MPKWRCDSLGARIPAFLMIPSGQLYKKEVGLVDLCLDRPSVFPLPPQLSVSLGISLFLCLVNLVYLTKIKFDRKA